MIHQKIQTDLLTAIPSPSVASGVVVRNADAYKKVGCTNNYMEKNICVYQVWYETFQVLYCHYIHSNSICSSTIRFVLRCSWLWPSFSGIFSQLGQFYCNDRKKKSPSYICQTFLLQIPGYKFPFVFLTNPKDRCAKQMGSVRQAESDCNWYVPLWKR
jgi:hypothetical protein